MSFAVKDNHFIFNKQLHEQNVGVAMGSQLGPSLANINTCALEKKFLFNCPLHFKPLLYRGYVDDTSAFISFTHELEDNTSLPSLGVLSTRTDNGFSTNSCRKKTLTSLYINFDILSPVL